MDYLLLVSKNAAPRTALAYRIEWEEVGVASSPSVVVGSAQNRRQWKGSRALRRESREQLPVSAQCSGWVPLREAGTSEIHHSIHSQSPATHQGTRLSIDQCPIRSPVSVAGPPSLVDLRHISDAVLYVNHISACPPTSSGDDTHRQVKQPVLTRLGLPSASLLSAFAASTLASVRGPTLLTFFTGLTPAGPGAVFLFRMVPGGVVFSTFEEGSSEEEGEMVLLPWKNAPRSKPGCRNADWSSKVASLASWARWPKSADSGAVISSAGEWSLGKDWWIEDGDLPSMLGRRWSGDWQIWCCTASLFDVYPALGRVDARTGRDLAGGMQRLSDEGEIFLGDHDECEGLDLVLLHRQSQTDVKPRQAELFVVQLMTMGDRPEQRDTS
nr:hypothetical protein CFP56_70990 [Quercus suber]